MAYNRLIGNIGEEVACKWLKNHDFSIVERNYLRKWGELDIVAQKDKILHFIEVKSAIKAQKDTQMTDGGYRPEENVHELKIRRLKRTIQTYLQDNRLKPDSQFKFHIISVYLNPETRLARVNFMEDIIL